MSKNQLSLCILIFYPAFLFAQQQNVRFDHLSTEDGLSNNFCYCTFQDQDGYIWIGTDDGLNRWDGYDFKIFKNNPNDSCSISNNKIFGITEDKEGILWISTAYGLNRYDKKTEQFERYFFSDQEIKVPHANSIGPIIDDSTGIFWIGTRVGLVCFDKYTGQYKRFVPEPGNLDFSLMGINTCSWIFKESNNVLVIGTADGLIKFHILSGKFERISPSHKHQPNERMRPVAEVIRPFLDKQGNIWVQTVEGGLHKYNIKNKKLSIFKEFHRITGITSYDQIWSISEASSGRICITTIGKGLFCVDLKNNTSIQYLPDPKDKNSISSRWLTNVYTDKQGILWVATFDKGINIITNPDKKVTIYDYNSNNKKSPPAGEIMDLCEDDDGWLWIATLPGGAAKLNLETKEFIHIPYMTGSPNATMDRRISALLKDRSGTMWLGGNGLDKYHAGQDTFTHFVYNPNDTNSLSNNFILSMVEDMNGYIWCGMRGSGLDRFDPKENISRHYRNNPENPNSLCNDVVRIVYQDYEGFLWLGTEDGLCRLAITDDNVPEFISYKYQRNNPNSLTNNFVYSVFEDSQNRLWIGTDRGLNLFDRERQMVSSFPEIKQINRNTIYSILEDDHSNLWLRTNIGLIRFNPDSKKYRVFNESDGFKACRSIVYGYQGFTKGKDGMFYYGAPQSLMVFHPDSLETKRKPPGVVLTDLMINYKPVEIAADSPLKKAINFSDEIKLDYMQKNLTFQFSALDYLESQKIQYAYKMEGINESWVNCGNQRTAPYTNLGPGRYVFRVEASYNNEDWSEQEKSILITIEPPWWKLWWVRALVMLLIFTLIGLLYKRRTAYLKRQANARKQYSEQLIRAQEEERRRIGSELHDGHGQNLLIANNEIQQFVENHPRIGQELTPALDTIQESIREVRAISSELHPHVLERLGLQQAIESMVQKLEAATDIRFEMQFVTGLDRIDKMSRLQVFRIIQESLNNVIKHAHATKVKILFSLNEATWRLEVLDDGSGFDVHKSIRSGAGFGLSDMRQRAEMMDARIRVTSSNEQGTCIELQFESRT